LTVLLQTIADIIELQVMRRYTRPMQPDETEEQVRQNLRSVHANGKLLKLLKSQDADGAAAYWPSTCSRSEPSCSGPTPTRSLTFQTDSLRRATTGNTWHRGAGKNAWAPGLLDPVSGLRGRACRPPGRVGSATL
jgi:hypothetical protein